MAKGNANIRKVEDDREDAKGIDETDAPVAAPANIEEAAETVMDDKDGFTDDRKVLRIVTRLPVNEEETEKLDKGKLGKGLPKDGGEVMGAAVRGSGKGQYLVVTTTAGQKYTRKM